MSTPYANIGDATEDSACITDSNGYDVAWLTRVAAVAVHPTHPTLTDEQWQQLINLIAAAPDLLAVMCEVRDIGVLSCCCDRPNGKCCGTCTATKIEAVIAKARGGAK